MNRFIIYLCYPELVMIKMVRRSLLVFFLSARVMYRQRVLNFPRTHPWTTHVWGRTRVFPSLILTWENGAQRGAVSKQKAVVGKFASPPAVADLENQIFSKSGSGTVMGKKIVPEGHLRNTKSALTFGCHQRKTSRPIRRI